MRGVSKSRISYWWGQCKCHDGEWVNTSWDAVKWFCMQIARGWRGGDHIGRKEEMIAKEEEMALSCAGCWARFKWSALMTGRSWGRPLAFAIFILRCWPERSTSWNMPCVFGHCTPAPALNRSLWETPSLTKCPKPSGQAFRPGHPNGKCPNIFGIFFGRASLKHCTCSDFILVLSFGSFHH